MKNNIVVIVVCFEMHECKKDFGELFIWKSYFSGIRGTI